MLRLKKSNKVKIILFLFIIIIFINVIINNKNANNRLNLNIKKYIYNYKDNSLGITKEQCSYVNPIQASNGNEQFDESNFIDKEKAISDIEFLFNVTKYSYAGYQYFGGDNTFQNAKESIVNAINEFDKDEITTEEIYKLVSDNMNFIQDGHFQINNISSLENYKYFSNEGIVINKYKKEYYILEDKKKLYIQSINGETNLDKYIKQSINDNGELYYCFGILDKANSLKILKVKLKDEDTIIEKKIELSNINSEKYYSKNNTSYNYKEVNNTPIITMRRMYNQDSNDNSEKLFSESAKLIKDKPVAIIDLRGNEGGQDICGLKWFKNFIGEAPCIEKSSIQLCSRINNYVTKKAIKNVDYTSLSNEFKLEYKKELDRANKDTNQWYISRTEEKHHKNSTKVFVIIDNNVASSGEDFISFLKTLDNVVLVGTNTNGAGLSCIYSNITLPNTKINIKFGNTLSFTKDFAEGKGFEPDIWIQGGDPLDRILKFIYNE